jgi:plastocyanin
MNRLRVLFVLSMCLLLVVPAATNAASTTVDTAGMKFQPDITTVSVGGSVTWTNHDAVAHNAVARDGSWRTPNFLPNDTAEITFQSPGSFPYICSLHPQMTGTINVVAAPATDTSVPGPVPAGTRTWPLLVVAALAGLAMGIWRFAGVRRRDSCAGS